MEKEKRLEDIIAENLIYYRKALGLTQLDLAEKLNYSDKLISKWERGEGMPDIIVLKTLADLYKIQIDDFYKEEKQKTPISKTNKRWYIVGLSALLLWLVATTVFVTLAIVLPETFYWWLIFVYAITGTGIVGVVWAGIFHHKLFQLIATSVIIWGGVVSIYLTLLLTIGLNNLWLIFIVGVPLEGLAVLWFFLRRGTRKKIKIKKANDK